MFNYKLIITILLLFPKIIFSQDKPLEFTYFNPDSTQEELRGLFTEFSQKHPGFYRYNDTSSFNQEIDSALSTITNPINELEIYRLLKPIFAKIGCLHTSISLSPETEQQLEAQSNCLPLLLYYKKGQAFIWKNYSDEKRIPLESEVLSLNGRDIQSIYQELLRNIPMDGFNQTGKYQLLEYSFPTWYRNIIEINDKFSIQIKTKDGVEKTFSINGIKAQELPSYQDLSSKKLNLNVLSDLAILTIPSFAKSYHKANGQKFKKEIKRYFKRIKNKKVKTVIVDLRGNTGGSDSNAAFFAAHFFDQPFRYWDRIEVSEPIAKDIKGLNRLFYSKPTKKDSIWLWKKSILFTQEFDFYQQQKPAKNNFQGTTYFIIDGLCMSSCADVAAVLSYNHKGTFVGQETGGGFQGNTSGLIPESQLSNGLIFSIPLLKYVNAVSPDLNFGRGTIPDLSIDSNPLETFNGQDLVLEKLLEHIKIKR